MGFVTGRPIKNLLYALTHPLVAAREKPILFMALAGTGIFFLGVWQGWWDSNVITGLFKKRT
tara:strand:- start:686 stop:871 length:186 start_codon:yes stop_codon:yes gene_type:complete